MFWLYRYAAVDRSMAGLSAENSPILDGSSLVAAEPSSPTTESPPSTMPAHNTRESGGTRVAEKSIGRSRAKRRRWRRSATATTTVCVCARATTCTICVYIRRRPAGVAYVWRWPCRRRRCGASAAGGRDKGISAVGTARTPQCRIAPSPFSCPPSTWSACNTPSLPGVWFSPFFFSRIIYVLYYNIIHFILYIRRFFPVVTDTYVDVYLFNMRTQREKERRRGKRPSKLVKIG